VIESIFMMTSTTVIVTPRNVTPRSYYRSSILLVFIVPALGGLLFGYDIGATSYAIRQLFPHGDAPVLTGLFVSAPSLGALLGSTILVFGLADAIGRKRELQYGSALYILGAVLESIPAFHFVSAAGESMPSGSIVILMMGRLVYGLGIGFSMHGAPTYLGEMLPSSIRGAGVSLKEVFIVLGILLGYVVGYINSSSSDEARFSRMHHNRVGWAYTYLASLVASICMFGLSFKIPFSARWLVLRGRMDEAVDSFRFVYRHGVAEQEHHDLVDALASQQSAISGRSDKGIFDTSRRAALVAGIGLVVLQQVTGQPSVLSYATPIFEAAGLSSYSSVLVALFKLFATSLAVATVEKYGRKHLLYLGCSLMLVALIGLSVSFHNSNSEDSGDTEGSNNDKWILVAMFVYIGGYQVRAMYKSTTSCEYRASPYLISSIHSPIITQHVQVGFGPMTWLIMSEVFPLSIRGQAVALAVQTNFLLNAVVQFGVPLLEAWIGLGNTFGLFALLTAYSIYFVHAHVLETKGLTLEEIEAKFAGKSRLHYGSEEERQSLVV
jgi:MFS family permease